jgi:hypothetical protein
MVGCKRRVFAGGGRQAVELFVRTQHVCQGLLKLGSAIAALVCTVHAAVLAAEGLAN